MKSQKISISLPEKLLDEARKYSGERGLSRFVAEGVRTQILAQRQRDLIKDWEDEFGALTDEEKRQADEWLDG